jgi:hypothetical protein
LLPEHLSDRVVVGVKMDRHAGRLVRAGIGPAHAFGEGMVAQAEEGGGDKLKRQLSHSVHGHWTPNAVVVTNGTTAFGEP